MNFYKIPRGYPESNPTFPKHMNEGKWQAFTQTIPCINSLVQNLVYVLSEYYYTVDRMPPTNHPQRELHWPNGRKDEGVFSTTHTITMSTVALVLPKWHFICTEQCAALVTTLVVYLHCLLKSVTILKNWMMMSKSSKWINAHKARDCRSLRGFQEISTLWLTLKQITCHRLKKKKKKGTKQCSCGIYNQKLASWCPDIDYGIYQ